MWRVRVDDACIASGSCQAIAPDRFALGTDHHAYPLTPVVEPDEAVLDAAASCPVEAITITDLDTGAVVDPA